MHMLHALPVKTAVKTAVMVTVLRTGLIIESCQWQLAIRITSGNLQHPLGFGCEFDVRFPARTRPSPKYGHVAFGIADPNPSTLSMLGHLVANACGCRSETLCTLFNGKKVCRECGMGHL
jgi:hypothetical protein